MKPVRFHRLAEDELYDAAHYYEKQSSGLGETFLNEVWQNIEHILAQPRSCPLISTHVRKKVLKRFPFTLLYRIEQDEQLFILAVMHQQRRPNYWHHRM